MMPVFVCPLCRLSESASYETDCLVDSDLRKIFRKKTPGYTTPWNHIGFGILHCHFDCARAAHPFVESVRALSRVSRAAQPHEMQARFMQGRGACADALSIHGIEYAFGRGLPYDVCYDIAAYLTPQFIACKASAGYARVTGKPGTELVRMDRPLVIDRAEFEGTEYITAIRNDLSPSKMNAFSPPKVLFTSETSEALTGIFFRKPQCDECDEKPGQMWRAWPLEGHALLLRVQSDVGFLPRRECGMDGIALTLTVLGSSRSRPRVSGARINVRPPVLPLLMVYARHPPGSALRARTNRRHECGQRTGAPSSLPERG